MLILFYVKHSSSDTYPSTLSSNIDPLNMSVMIIRFYITSDRKLNY